MSNDSKDIKRTEIINTVEGPIRGIVEGEISTFRGIPYAAPPVGPLRWRAPAPVTPWTTELGATKNGPSSWQDVATCEEVGGGHPGEMSEDCLYLNVWSPRLEPGAKLPVMVWIHGGAYIIGSGGLNIYDGRPLATKGAVVVSINYRLGCLGFFKHPVLEAETAADEAKVNNFGLLDQIAALEWVNRNIEKFGGDPGNVTIFGQSAGARSVLALYASPLIKGREAKLFHKGIAQSVYRMMDVLGDKAEKRCIKLVGLVAPTREALTPERLRALSAEKLLNIDKELTAEQLEGTSNSPVAIVGDSVLPKGVLKAFADGDALPLPLIIGNTSDDISVVLDTPQLTEQSMIDLSLRKATTLVTYYPDLEQDADKLDKTEIGRRVGRDAFFTEVTNRIGRVHTAKGGSAWQFYFDYTAEGLRGTVLKGTRHGDDVVFTLDTGDHADLYAPPPKSPPETERIAFTPADHAFADKVSEYWFQFARTGTPSCAGSQSWPATTAEHSNTLMLGNAKATGAAGESEITLQPDFMKTNMSNFATIGGLYDLFIAALA